MSGESHFDRLCKAARQKHGRDLMEGSVLGIDPGQTTGYCHLKVTDGRATLISVQQLNTKQIEDCAQVFLPKFQEIQPTIIVVEQYRVYGNKTKQHANSNLHTSQVIGVIKGMAALTATPVVEQGAGIAKQWCTNDKLRQWGFYQPGLKHAMDAVRHACYYTIFGPAVNQSKGGHHVG